MMKRLLKNATLATCCVGIGMMGLSPSFSKETGVVESALADVSISRLAENGVVQFAFQTIVEMESINTERLIKITEIPAPPFKEQKRAQALIEMIQVIGGTQAQIDTAGNVVARRRGAAGEKTLAIVAHIDTVFPIETDVTVRREGDRFYAPEIGDNSCGLVVLLCVLQAIERHVIKTRDDILFIGSIGEEGLGDLRGVRHLFRPGAPRIDSFVAIDGGRADRLVVDAVGSTRYRVTFNGPGGHSYGAFGRANPHNALARAMDQFTKAARPITAQGVKSTFNIGRVGGGTSVTSIPFASWMEVDMRSADPAKLNQLDDALKTAAYQGLERENKRRTENDALTVEMTSVGQRPAGKGARSSALLQNDMAAMRARGLDPDLKASSTDANIPISLGIPAVTMSRGGITYNAHAPDEYWEAKDPHIAIQALFLATLAQTGLAP